MRLPENVRRQFQDYGKKGGRTRAKRLSPARRSAIARRAALRRWTETRFGTSSFESLGLPGGELIDSGLDDLVSEMETIESLLISLAASRLRREGVPLPPSTLSNAHWRLYRLLEKRDGDLAHPRFLAYLRQVESFADACRDSRADRGDHAS